MRAPIATIYYHKATADGNARASIHQDYGKQSEDSGDCQHCCDRHHCSSDECRATQRIHGDQETLSPSNNAGGHYATITREKPWSFQNEHIGKITQDSDQSPASCKTSVKYQHRVHRVLWTGSHTSIEAVQLLQTFRKTSLQIYLSRRNSKEYKGQTPWPYLTEI